MQNLNLVRTAEAVIKIKKKSIISELMFHKPLCSKEGKKKKTKKRNHSSISAFYTDLG